MFLESSKGGSSVLMKKGAGGKNQRSMSRAIGKQESFQAMGRDRLSKMLAPWS
jgi:hypothetical protein